MSTDLQKGEAHVSLHYLTSISLDIVFLSIDVSCRVKRLGGGGHLTSNDIKVDDDDADELPALIDLNDCTYQRPVKSKL
ncbi:hypothetical protein B0H16DRAFT_1748261 [Mycena metata]|uniref:Uncharacterized protein n=1 Tax=Mycena metata TaxID=1033252 RepID=A0AAD7DY74_9AGAR|nr:hypothetical protein B0H16DRAFT_1748261 [Mycena metata]